MANITKWNIIANIHGEIINLGVSARYTRKALIAAAQAKGEEIAAKMTDAELALDWKYTRGILTFAPGVFVKFGDTVRQCHIM